MGSLDASVCHSDATICGTIRINVALGDQQNAALQAILGHKTISMTMLRPRDHRPST
jgi:hypothetical protein